MGYRMEKKIKTSVFLDILNECFKRCVQTKSKRQNYSSINVSQYSLLLSWCLGPKLGPRYPKMGYSVIG